MQVFNYLLWIQTLFSSLEEASIKKLWDKKFSVFSNCYLCKVFLLGIILSFKWFCEKQPYWLLPLSIQIKSPIIQSVGSCEKSVTSLSYYDGFSGRLLWSVKTGLVCIYCICCKISIRSYYVLCSFSRYKILLSTRFKTVSHEANFC